MVPWSRRGSRSKLRQGSTAAPSRTPPRSPTRIRQGRRSTSGTSPGTESQFIHGKKYQSYSPHSPPKAIQQLADTESSRIQYMDCPVHGPYENCERPQIRTENNTRAQVSKVPVQSPAICSSLFSSSPCPRYLTTQRRRRGSDHDQPHTQTPAARTRATRSVHADRDKENAVE